MGESPPHMRGKARHCAAVHGYRGITPAHAGKSTFSRFWTSNVEDHPRTCGEKHFPHGSNARFPWITPAHAGKSTQESADGCPDSGSPPHMRGKVAQKDFRCDRVRITPAHAGKSICKSAGAADSAGSPPHMRGKDLPRSCEGCRRGITPAHAGKRAHRAPGAVGFLDHPRTCGEKRISYSITVSGMGSPPHMRGKEHGIRTQDAAQRITPAHAGKRQTMLFWN